MPEVAEDVTDAAHRGTLLSDVVLAKGTEARYTVDGLKAVNRQLQEDILPQVRNPESFTCESLLPQEYFGSRLMHQ